MATMPKLDIPSTMNKPGPWVILPIGPTSDGDLSKQKPPPYRDISNDVYRVRIASLWAEHQGNATIGINYYLDRLPRGYQLMDFPKHGDTGLRYKRLFGHPSGRFYDSQLRFFPHFLWLMGNMKGRCGCVLCNKNNKPAPAPKPIGVKPVKDQPEMTKLSRELASRDTRTELGKRGREVANYYSKELYQDRDKRITKTVGQSVATDEEGTPDIYKELVQLLYRHRESKKLIEEDIKEKASPDWRVEHNEKYGESNRILSRHLTQTRLQHSFVPRLGELVLWFRYHPDDVDLVYNPEVCEYHFYSPERKSFHGFPRWQAGVVTECPCSDPMTDFPDVLGFVDRKESVNRTGFRVETFPDPNNDFDKSASKQYKYVPLRQIRPLNMWQRILHGIPEDRLDASIKYALTCLTSVSLLEKYRFLGKWPDASIFCKGIYIGAELLIQGDAIKILPPPASSSIHPVRCTDILVISSVRLNLLGIEQQHTEPTSPGICRQSSITLVGQAYTLNPSGSYIDRSHTSMATGRPTPVPTEEIKHLVPTVGAADYGQWYPLHGPHQRYEVSFDRVLGRLYESGAVGMWTGSLGSYATEGAPPSLSYDLASVLAGRRYGSQTDGRIPSCKPDEIHWFWADTRVQALSVETINGLEVGVYDAVRDKATLRAWRARLKIVDGNYTPDDSKDAMLLKQRGRKKGSRVLGGVVVGPDGDSADEETEPPPRGSLSEAVRSQRGAGGMVVAGAALQDDDEGDDGRGEGRVMDDEDDTDDDRAEMETTEEDNDNGGAERKAIGDDEEGGEGTHDIDDSGDNDDSDHEPVPSRFNAVADQKPWGKPVGFILPLDPDVDMPTVNTSIAPPRAPQSEHTVRSLTPQPSGPVKARKSTGRAKLSFPPLGTSPAGRYDSSISPAMKHTGESVPSSALGVTVPDDAPTHPGKPKSKEKERAFEGPGEAVRNHDTVSKAPPPPQPKAREKAAKAREDAVEDGDDNGEYDAYRRVSTKRIVESESEEEENDDHDSNHREVDDDGKGEPGEVEDDEDDEDNDGDDGRDDDDDEDDDSEHEKARIRTLAGFQKKDASNIGVGGGGGGTNFRF